MNSLEGRRVVVTRAAHQSAGLVRLLRQAGAAAVPYPCIEVAPPEDLSPLDEALRMAAGGQFDWLIVTSANVARALARRLETSDLFLSELKVAAVGPATAAAIEELLRIDVRVMANKQVAADLPAAIAEPEGKHILLPQSALASPDLAQELRQAGATVTTPVAYRTVMGQGGADVPALLAERKVDAVTFTSPSTVRFFLRRLEREGGRSGDLEEVSLAAIGPVTAGALRQHQLPVAVMPGEHTTPALVAALARHFGDHFAGRNTRLPGDKYDLQGA